ncbi:MAG: type II toxin-antitoxin system prevent-host-death family antitoxin [Polyangia bacterium]
MPTIEIPAAEAKRRLADYLSRSSHGQCRVVVTRRGRPLAAIVSIEDLQDLEQLEKRRGLASVAGKWRGFAEIAADIEAARSSGGEGRDVSL